MEYKNQAKSDLIISILCFVGGVVLGFSQSQGIIGALGWGTIIGGVRYGWKVLTFITPNVFLILPLIGWVIYFLIKFFLSLCIAPFAFFIKTIANIVVLVKG